MDAMSILRDARLSSPRDILSLIGCASPRHIRIRENTEATPVIHVTSQDVLERSCLRLRERVGRDARRNLLVLP